MKKVTFTKSLFIASAALVMSCGGEAPQSTESNASASSEEKETMTESVVVEEKEMAEETVAQVQEEMEPAADDGLAERIKAGKKVYKTTCFACHQNTGKGIPGVFPPLAGSDYLNASVERAVLGVLNGQQGNMVVNGQTYSGEMPAQDLNDQEIADVLTYVYNSWDNNGSVVTPEQVAALRNK